MSATLRLAFLFACCLPAAAKAAETKNVILIMADDSAVDNYGCYGSKFFSTPQLDRLAATGAKFLHCYSEPVCTASRVKIMTGRDGWRNYVRFGTLDKSETTFGTMMKQHGYRTVIAGKWQLHGSPNGVLATDCGFDEHLLWNYPGSKRPRFWNPSYVKNGKPVPSTKEGFGPDHLVEFISESIRKHRDEPFFIYYPMVLVHAPFVPTPDSKNDKVKGIAAYRDMVAYADKCVGRLIDVLEETGLREKTVVIYTTDNGTGRGLTYPFGKGQRKGEKAYATEGGTHTPLIVNCPGTIPAGTVSDSLVEFSDFLPTIADITGAKLPNVELDGRTFWPQCQGQPGNPRKWIRQYYYPKFVPAAAKHGQGVNNREIVWAQNQHFKLYRDGSLYEVADRDEENVITPGTRTTEAEAARKLLQAAIDEIPSKAIKLNVN